MRNPCAGNCGAVPCVQPIRASSASPALSSGTVAPPPRHFEPLPCSQTWARTARNCVIGQGIGWNSRFPCCTICLHLSSGGNRPLRPSRPPCPSARHLARRPPLLAIAERRRLWPWPLPAKPPLPPRQFRRQFGAMRGPLWRQWIAWLRVWLRQGRLARPQSPAPWRARCPQGLAPKFGFEWRQYPKAWARHQYPPLGHPAL